MNFADKLMAAVAGKKTPLVVGLDPRLNRLPSALSNVHPADRKQIGQSIEEFCMGVIDVVAPLVAAVKPQAAFFELLGPDGMNSLYNVVRYARSKGLLVILDGKRGDIGSTAEAYAEAFLGDETNSGWACDCLTVNPYLGDDSLAPFVTRCKKVDAGIFVLVRTSNPGGKMLQELSIDGHKIFSIVGQHVQNLAADTIGTSGYGCVGAVVGATNPRQLTELRTEMPNTLFLVPGVGAQGATASDIAGAFDENGHGAVINSSRAIIFAYEREEYSKCGNDWQQAIELATRETIEQISTETNAGKLQKASVK